MFKGDSPLVKGKLTLQPVKITLPEQVICKGLALHTVEQIIHKFIQGLNVFITVYLKELHRKD